jgi:hypothetical protein
MAAPIICVYCREPIALYRDDYVLLPPEYSQGGDDELAHLACAEAHMREPYVLPGVGDRAPIRSPFEIIYLTQHANYKFALLIPHVVPSAVRRGLAFFRLWRTGQVPQEGLVLTMPELTSFYEDLGRLLEYLRRERRARPPSHPQLGAGGEHP